MLGDMKPFRMAGDLYFVGTYIVTSFHFDCIGARMGREG